MITKKERGQKGSHYMIDPDDVSNMKEGDQDDHLLNRVLATILSRGTVRKTSRILIIPTQ